MGDPQSPQRMIRCVGPYILDIYIFPRILRTPLQHDIQNSKFSSPEELLLQKTGDQPLDALFFLFFSLDLIPPSITGRQRVQEGGGKFGKQLLISRYPLTVDNDM
eukprot:1378439-Amorphochlora_amoeboformis.AAC.2